jgi:hypothetical protein
MRRRIIDRPRTRSENRFDQRGGSGLMQPATFAVVIAAKASFVADSYKIYRNRSIKKR